MPRPKKGPEGLPVAPHPGSMTQASREEIMAKSVTRTKVRARVKKSSARRSARHSPARAKAAAKARPKQKFAVHRYSEDGFKVDGLRAYAKYRDLGILGATNGGMLAHVIRFLPPFEPKVVSKLHLHDVNYQMIYVLKGWISTNVEGEGELKMNAGDAWLQPPRVKHKVTGYSDDCEVLEIVLPGNFDTVELDA
jgi:mannose-6-phosphate isomerase-like protein (cupin superfamily)